MHQGEPAHLLGLEIVAAQKFRVEEEKVRRGHEYDSDDEAGAAVFVLELAARQGDHGDAGEEYEHDAGNEADDASCEAVARDVEPFALGEISCYAGPVFVFPKIIHNVLGVPAGAAPFCAG